MMITPLNASAQNAGAARAPLALMHGWGLDGRIWDALVPHLAVCAPDLPLLRVDLPGYHGTPYAGEDALAVAQALATQLPHGSVLAGWSLGGMLAQLAALQPHSAVAQLVLISTTPSFVQREGFSAAMAPALLEAFKTGVNTLPSMVMPHFAALSNQGDTRSREINRQIKPLTRDPLPDKAALLAGLDWLEILDLREWTAAIQQPALVIHGAQDHLIPLAAGQWLAEHLPQATLLTLPNAGHAPFLHDTQHCAAAIVHFVGADA